MQALLDEARLNRVFSMQWRILSFGFGGDDLRALNRDHQIFGVIATLLVGVGRYWDHPDPYLFQSLGIGSLSIAALLSLLVYLVVLPLKPRDWDLANLATFITLTALPALLYAIPVERFLALPQARSANVAFLAAIAAWRVGLLYAYLRRRAEFPRWLSVVALLLPTAGVIVVLTALNLEQAVFDLMSGLHDDSTPADAAYSALALITAFALILFPALVAAYIAGIVLRRRSAAAR